MQHKSFAGMPCPIARSLERVGEWWSILILRDTLRGARRFDELQKSLAIAPNMLARRLNALVESGLLERRRYSVRPPRYEYVPTERAHDFRPVLWMLLSWGNRHFAPEGPSVEIVDAKTGAPADPIVVDRATGRPLTSPDFALAPGPAANARIRRVYGFADEPVARPADDTPRARTEHPGAATTRTVRAKSHKRAPRSH